MDEVVSPTNTMSKVGVMAKDNATFDIKDENVKELPDTNYQLHTEDPVRSKQSESPKWYKREDLIVWFSGIAFIAAMIAMIFVVGNARGWDADSGFTHNTSLTSDDRFLPEPFIPEEGVRGRYGTDCAARWYYWKVKTDELTFWTHFFPWVCYLLHQVLIWASIFHAQMLKAHEPLGRKRYSTNMSAFNWISLGLNIFFHMIHFINTHTTYDGTAQDVAIATSQGSVIMLLTLVIILEYRDRGILFGWPTPSSTSKVAMATRLNYGPVNIIRKYHGYAFSWGCIYTFWYHPMENTWGHAMGFIYTWLIMLQGSLMFTPLHQNKYWTVFLECYVVVHGGTVAWQTGGPSLGGTLLWPMFVFGFGLCFVITQIFGLPLWKHLPKWTRVIPLLIYTGFTLWCFGAVIPDKDGNYWTRLPEILRIPATYYLAFVFGWATLYAFIQIELTCKSKSPAAPVPASPLKQTLYLMAALSVYVVHIVISILTEYLDAQMTLVALMIIFTLLFCLGANISFMFLKQAIPNYIPPLGEKINVALAEKTHISSNQMSGIDGKVTPAKESTRVVYGSVGQNKDTVDLATHM